MADQLPLIPVNLKAEMDRQLAQLTGRGSVIIDATMTGLEGRVGWRVAPWWEITGIVQSPWGTPGKTSFAIETAFRW